jgi:hypothetical protein
VGRIFLLLGCLTSAVACDDLSDFRTNEMRVFRGGVIGGPEDGFIRQGFASGTEMVLRFDASQAHAGAPPGDVTTTDVDASGQPTFDRTSLSPLTQLSSDPLSQYEFPGDGRLENFIFFARPLSGALATRDAVVFVSLMQGTRVEVRVTARTADAEPQTYFGVFPLKLRSAP